MNDEYGWATFAAFDRALPSSGWTAAERRSVFERLPREARLAMVEHEYELAAERRREEIAAAPEHALAAFFLALAKEQEAERNEDLYLAALDSDDPVPPVIPATVLPKRPIRWEDFRSTNLAASARQRGAATVPTLDAFIDLLRSISPIDYWQAITGEEPIPAGRNARGTCPNPDHPDRHPSATVYGEMNAGWFCHVCEAGGDAINLASYVTGLDSHREFRELCAFVAERINASDLVQEKSPTLSERAAA